MFSTTINARASWLALGFMLVLPVGTGASAQTDDWCNQDNWGRDREGVCEVRQLTVAATGGVLAVQTTNGGIDVVGQARGDVHVEAKVVATAETQARAREIANAVRINATIDRVEADGPRTQNREGWSVSFRIAVPRALNMSVQTTNGGIRLSELDSKVDFRTTNGGVKLLNLAGDVKGRTTNGGIDVDLEGSAWMGEGLDVETTNGGVRLSLPEHYSATLEATTNNGGMNIDFPGAPRSPRERDISMRLGSGGAPIRVRTSNGGIRVNRK
jgi:DUF4097 and DUF4098 domain-containing protein YvlB